MRLWLFCNDAAQGTDIMALLLQDLDEMNIEIMRNTLYKAYLDDFAAFCASLGGATEEVMGELLSFEVRLCHCMECRVPNSDPESTPGLVQTYLLLCDHALFWTG